jgi:hypothetical protein
LLGKRHILVGRISHQHDAERAVLHQRRDVPRDIEIRMGGIARLDASGRVVEPSRARDRTSDIAAQLDQAADELRAAGLAGEVKALKTVALLEHIERGIHHLELDHGLAPEVVAGGSFDADPPQIDRRGLGHLGGATRQSPPATS